MVIRRAGHACSLNEGVRDSFPSPEPKALRAVLVGMAVGAVADRAAPRAAAAGSSSGDVLSVVRNLPVVRHAGRPGSPCGAGSRVRRCRVD